MSADGLTAALARHVVAAPVDDLPAHAAQSAGELLLDTVGVALAGAHEPAAAIARDVAAVQGGAPLAIVLGTTDRTSSVAAALVNGTAAHALDLDDSHHPGFLHPSAVLVPALLALAEPRPGPLSGRRLLAAHVQGLETIAAVGSAINTRHYELGWHATATIGTLGATAAGAKLIGLDAERTATALAIAASQAGGIRRNFGSMVKPLHAGLAARNAVLAVLLAERGMVAGEAPLEGERGLFDLIAGPGHWNADAAYTVLDAPFGLAFEGLAVKRFASCGVTHPPIEAALALREEHGVTADAVTELVLEVHPLVPQIAVHDDPASGLAAKFSLPHCVAVALLDGAVGLDQFTDERAGDPAVAALRERVRIATDEALGTAGHMSWGCRLTAVLADGRRATAEVELARGKWAGERLTTAELEAKFLDCTAHAGIAPADGRACLDVLSGVDALTDLAPLWAALERGAAPAGPVTAPRG